MKNEKEFTAWKKELRKQQLYYPSLKFQEISKETLTHYFTLKMSPIDTLNNLITAV